MTTTTDLQSQTTNDGTVDPAMPSPIPTPAPPPGTFISEDEYFQKNMRENHTLPLLLTVGCGGLCLVLYTMRAFSEGGTELATSMAIGISILLAASTLTGTAAAWFVSKIFGENFGSIGVLTLHIAAVSCTELLIYLGVNTLIGPLMSLLIGLPCLIILSIWLVGMNLFQAFVFAIVLKIVEVLLISFILMSVASSMMA